MIIDSTVALSQLWVTYCSVRLSILITSRGATINGSVNRKKNDALFIVFHFFLHKNMSNISWFPHLKCEDLLLYLIYGRLVGQKK